MMGEQLLWRRKNIKSNDADIWCYIPCKKIFNKIFKWVWSTKYAHQNKTPHAETQL